MTKDTAPSSKIFLLDPDPDEHDDLLASISRPGVSWYKVFNKLSGKGVRCADWWQPVPMEWKPARVRKNRGKPVDFIGLMGLGLAFSDRAAEVLAPLLGNAIELLPLTYDGPGRFQVVNILDIVDCLDEERSITDRYSDGQISSVKKYVFKPGSTDGHHLFKCKQCLLHDLVSAEFKALVEKTGLIGAYFKPVGE
ncbi:MAG TPA: DUF1629 domain-containing protein [Polyangia bacterium]|jgi:hypothetical protein|nr:DUF1629 domain-containing protein [Polyangia bacterium]